MTTSRSNEIPEGAPEGKFHPGQIYDMFMHKHKNTLREQLGEPDEISEESGQDCWLYKALTYDFDNPKLVYDQKFLFDEDGNVDYDYLPPDSEQSLG